MKAGDLVRVKGRGVGRIVTYGRNKCLVETVADPEFYADLDSLVSETRWVETIKLQEYKPKRK